MGNIGRYFNRSEFACGCGCGSDGIDPQIVRALDALREHFGRPVRVTSGVRCESHNQKVGGAADSAHIKGLAADIAVSSSAGRYGILQRVFALDEINRIGIGKDFIHVDVDGRKPGRVLWTY